MAKLTKKELLKAIVKSVAQHGNKLKTADEALFEIRTILELHKLL